MKPEHIMTLLAALALTSCESLFGGRGSNSNTITTTSQSMDEMGKVIQETTTTVPYVSPAEAAHAEATKNLFSE